MACLSELVFDSDVEVVRPSRIRFPKRPFTGPFIPRLRVSNFGVLPTLLAVAAPEDTPSRHSRRRGPDLPKADDWYQLLMRKSTLRFKKHMRLNRETFDYVVDVVRPLLTTAEAKPGKPSASVEQRVAATIWYAPF